jgi:hypothetical protein
LNFDSGLNSIDLANAAELSPGNFIFVAGTYADKNSNTQVLILKTDTAGNLIWNKNFTDPEIHSASAIDLKTDAEGNSIILASGRKASGQYIIVLIKLNSEGDLLWRKIFDESNLHYTPVGLAIDENSNCYISSSVQNSKNVTDIISIKYSSNGNFEWKRIYKGAAGNDDRPVKIIERNDNLIITGVTYSIQSHFDIVTLKYNQAGDLLWNRIFNASGNHLDYPYDLTSDSAGNIYITGSSRSDSLLGSEDIIILKYDIDGNLMLNTFYNGKAGGSDIGFSIALDGDNNIYIGGSTDRGNFQMIYATLKFSSNGIFQWVQTYYDSETPEDFIYEIALNKSGDVFVSGISFNSETDYDFATIKYSQPVVINPSSEHIPIEYKIYQNYPNPFNPVTMISYELPVMSDVKLSVYDILGKEIVVLINKRQNAGRYHFQFSSDYYQLGSGVFIYSLSTENITLSKKMILFK